MGDDGSAPMVAPCCGGGARHRKRERIGAPRASARARDAQRRHARTRRGSQGSPRSQRLRRDPRARRRRAVERSTHLREYEAAQSCRRCRAARRSRRQCPQRSCRCRHRSPARRAGRGAAGCTAAVLPDEPAPLELSADPSVRHTQCHARPRRSSRRPALRNSTRSQDALARGDRVEADDLYAR